MTRLASLLAALCLTLPVDAYGQVTLLHEFAGGANDGNFPEAGLTLSGSTLFGTTRIGGDANQGTVFSINTDGSNFQLLHEFAGGANDGNGPVAGLTLSGSTLFGTTSNGGDADRGTVFSIPICQLDLVLTFESSTLTLDFLLGPNVPVTWNTWLFVDTGVFLLWSAPLPPFPTVPLTFEIPGFPDLGLIGVLTTFDTGDAYICWGFDFVVTGPPGLP